MKKLVGLLIFVLLLGSMAMAEIDISGLSYDELVELKNKVDAEIFRQNEEEFTMVTLSSGKEKPIRTGFVAYCNDLIDLAYDYKEQMKNEEVWDIDIQQSILVGRGATEFRKYYEYGVDDLYAEFYWNDVALKIKDIL